MRVLIFLVLFGNITLALADENWKWFDKIFGSLLRNTFASPDTLQLSVNETRRKVNKLPGLKTFQFQCFKYQEGARTGKRLYIALRSSI